MDLFKKKEPIDAKRFCELFSELENVRLNGKFNNEKGMYCVNVPKSIPPGYKMKEPFEIIYDHNTKMLYCVEVNYGKIKLTINNKTIELSTSDIIAINATVAGKFAVQMTK